MTEPERLELVTRLMNYHDQVLIGFRHISRLEEAELIQAAIEALRPRLDWPKPGTSYQCKCGRAVTPTPGASRWRCDCGAMVFIVNGGG